MPMFTTSDGVEIRYEAFGDGPPVAVLQGGPSNICDSLIAGLAPMADSCSWIFHDYRGSGRSGSAPPETYTFERIADDLDELRRHLGFSSMAVLAHSMGGFMAVNYALRHPGACDRLALVGTTPCGKARPMAIPLLRALGPVRTMKALAMAVRFVLLWSWRRPSLAKMKAGSGPMSVTQEARRELRPKVASVRMPAVENDNAAYLMKAVGGVDLRPELGRVTCPVLVLYGSRDAVMVAGGKMHARDLPSAEVVVLPDIGHEPFIEAPDETFARMRSFLAG
jgi:pimeloyl-ACP methyl ester carboxylesterase